MSHSTSLTEKPSAKEQHLPLLLVRLSNQYLSGSSALPAVVKREGRITKAN